MNSAEVSLVSFLTACSPAGPAARDVGVHIKALLGSEETNVGGNYQLSSILFGDTMVMTMVPNIE